MTRTFYTGLLLTCTILFACEGSLNIIDKPVTFDETRKQLSLEYLKVRHGIETGSVEIDPKIIVVHWTVIPTLEKTFETFNPSRLSGTRTGIKDASSLNVSAHFVIDRDGTIYQLLPETTFARHVIGLNHCAIGIENVANGTDLPLTRQQFKANLRLINYLSGKYNIEYLIGHDQYQQFIGHPLWKETDPNYLTEKNDVGPEFIRKLHQSIDHELKPAPGLEK